MYYYTVCYFTCTFYAVVRQISMLFIDNKDYVFCTNFECSQGRMWGQFSAMTSSFNNSIYPPEMKTHPLKMVCGCPCGGVVKWKGSHRQSSHAMKCVICQCITTHTGWVFSWGNARATTNTSLSVSVLRQRMYMTYAKLHHYNCNQDLKEDKQDRMKETINGKFISIVILLIIPS